jgi:hypothetical protein
MEGRVSLAYPQLRWQFVVFPHNEHELPKARAMANDLGMLFYAKLSWTETGAFADPELVRRETGVVSRAEYEERFGQDYAQAICHQLWDRPQVNFDGKMLGCCRNFWGDFGSNAFTEGLAASVNSEKMNYARKMLRGDAASRADIPLHHLRDLSRHAAPRQMAGAAGGQEGLIRCPFAFEKTKTEVRRSAYSDNLKRRTSAMCAMPSSAEGWDSYRATGFFAGLVDRFTAAFRRASQWDCSLSPPAFRAAVMLASYCFRLIFDWAIGRHYQARCAAQGQNGTTIL